MSGATTMDDATLVARFEDATLAESAFGHREHVRVAWALLRAEPFEIAAARFCGAIRRFTASLGRADRYHETITWAYLALVNERLDGARGAGDFEAFAQANPDLFDRVSGALAAYYEEGILGSAKARRVFVLPRRG